MLPATVSFAAETLAPRELHRMLLSLVVPRPIAWISSVGAAGISNLAPFSFFNIVSAAPPILMVSIGRRRGSVKDTLRNVEESGEFVVNLVEVAAAAAMNQTSGDWPYEADEFELAGMTPAPSVQVRAPRVATAPAAMEVQVTQIVPVSESSATLVLGRVVHFHLRADLLQPEGGVAVQRLQPLARLGGAEYAEIGRVFAMTRPK